MKLFKKRVATSIFSGILAAGALTVASISSLAQEVIDAPQRLIIKYNEGAALQGSKFAQTLSSMLGENMAFRRNLALPNRKLFQFQSKLSQRRLDLVMNMLRARPDIASVELDVLMQPNYVPNDTRYNEQWHYFEATGGINAQSAWDKQDGTGIVVAVIDTGYVFHPDLDANMIAGYDMITDTSISNDGDGRDGDASDPGDWVAAWECGFFSPARNSSWHGTHVAGTIAAVTNNGQGVAGVAFGAKVQPVRVLGKCGGYLSDIADGIIWASGGSVAGVPANATPADVINMSLGGSGACDSTYQAAIDTAVANGTTVVVSAGNSNDDSAGYRPASCSNVINVASTDRQGNRASYSNYGAIVDVSAPGGETATTANGVLSTLNTGTQGPGSPSYAFYQGTSMAAPHVAGAAALLYAANGSITPAEVESALKATARSLPGSCSGGCGAGIIDASAAIDQVSGTPGNARPTSDFTFVVTGLTADFTDASSDSDGTIASYSWDFGDGATSTLQNPSHTYATDGVYTVTLTVTDDMGDSDASQKDVTAGNPGPVNGGFTESNLSANRGDWLHYTLDVPTGAVALDVNITGGSGDADLYVRYGAQPTTGAYDCRPYLNGNNETCNFSNPNAGTWHISIRAYRAYSGVTLNAEWRK